MSNMRIWLSPCLITLMAFVAPHDAHCQTTTTQPMYKYPSAATAEAVQARLQQYVSVMDFGAVGDGSTDDTAAFQNAIKALTSGGSLWVPNTVSGYVVGALTLAQGVVIQCASGATLRAKSNDETMITVPSGVYFSGISGVGGYCNLSGNSKSGFKAIESGNYGGGPTFTENNTFENLYISGAAICVDSFQTYFSLFQNINCFQMTVAGFEFETNTTTLTCSNCSAIYTGSGSAPYCFYIHNNGTIDVGGKSTCQGNVKSLVYQSNNDNLDIYYENSGGTNTNPWIQIGLQNGSSTFAINLSGSTFSVGAQYAVEIEQVTGLVVHGAAFSTSLGAFRVNNNGSANGTLRGIDIRSNAYNIGGGGYDPTKIIIFANSPGGNDLSNNLGTDSPDPFICVPVAPGKSLTPPSAALSNFTGQGWCDGLTGYWNWEWKDGSGSLHRQIQITDATLSPIGVWPNLATPGTGSANNAIVGTNLLDPTGNQIPLVSGKTRITLQLTGGFSLQAGPNTLSLNGSGPASILKSSNFTNLTTAYGSNAFLDLFYFVQEGKPIWAVPNQ